MSYFAHPVAEFLREIERRESLLCEALTLPTLDEKRAAIASLVNGDLHDIRTLNQFCGATTAIAESDEVDAIRYALSGCFGLAVEKCPDCLASPE